MNAKNTSDFFFCHSIFTSDIICIGALELLAPVFIFHF